MADLDLLYFELLKNKVQNEFLKYHTPSEESISLWKGIDIVYFQEDLRKKAKGNMSEKSFYTYFKTMPIKKLPRIDMLNLLCVYSGYSSWYEFKKLNQIQPLPTSSLDTDIIEEKQVSNPLIKNEEKSILQKKDNDKQEVKTKTTPKKNQNIWYIKPYIWVIATLVLLLTLFGFIFYEKWLTKSYSFKFIDADRNTSINALLDIKILINGESPILQKVKPNDILTYTTKSKKLVMVISSPYYKTDTIYRNLENSPLAPAYETIELKPDDYAIMLNYYSKKADVDVNKKRERLNRLISDQALIYQVFDNETYGVEILDKERYITLMTTPTTSLKNLQMISTQMKNGKIVMIKFRITNNNES